MVNRLPRIGAPLIAGLIPVVLLIARPEEARPAAAMAQDEAFALSDWPPGAAAARGRRPYEENCIGCHGETGLGDGPAAVWLNPLPRNFQKGYFKFRSTSSGQAPSADDLMRTITCGLPGSSMPSFRLLPEPERRDLVAYVRYLVAFGRARLEVDYLREMDGLSLAEIRQDHLAEIRERVEQEVYQGPRPVALPPEPDATPEAIERGRVRYLKECAACHGTGGVGDGPSSFTLRDWQDAEIRPRDFTSGVFRAGSTPRDLFIRLRSGLNGTPMPSTPGADQDLWDLVHYIMSLVDPAQAPSRPHPGCESEEGGR